MCRTAEEREYAVPLTLCNPKKQGVIRKPFNTSGYNCCGLYRVDIKILIKLLIIISIEAYTALLLDECSYTETI